MDNRLQKYARLTIQQGINIQKGQPLVINAPVSAVEFVRLCTEEAYLAGASKVDVNWSDDQLTKLHYENVDTEILKKVGQWRLDQHQHAIDTKSAFLRIGSDIPGNLKSIDSNKLREVSMELSKAMEPFRYYTMANVGQWCVVAVPNKEWAELIFPQLKGELAVQALWEAIYAAVRIRHDNDPIEEWNDHNQEIHKHTDLLNRYNFKSLVFKNSLGTDIVVDLVENHIWAGGCDKTQSGIVFNPNLPTEETFTMPKRTGVNGKVVATKPLNYQGKLIENFWLRFENGKVVEYHAEKEEGALKNLLEVDENASYLGEVALISHDSPISNMDVLFFNTLFDENASCHLALGAAYPNNMKDGEKLSKEELLAKDCNVSMVHSDFMFGSADMHVLGLTYGGEEVEIFKNGNFYI